MDRINDFLEELSPLKIVFFGFIFSILIYSNLQSLLINNVQLFIETQDHIDEIVVEINGNPKKLTEKNFFQTNHKVIEGFYLNIKQKDKIRVISKSENSEVIGNYYIIKNTITTSEARLLEIDDKRKIQEYAYGVFGWEKAISHSEFIPIESNTTIEFSKSHYIHIFFAVLLLLIILSIKGWISFFMYEDRLFKILFASQLILFCYFINKIGFMKYEALLAGSASWYKFNWFPPSLLWQNYYLHDSTSHNLVFGASSDLIILITAKITFILDQLQIFPGSKKNFHLIQYLLIFMNLGLMYRYADKDISRFTILIFTVITPVFITLFSFNDFIISVLILLTAYSIFMKTNQTSRYFPIISFVALFFSFNTSFSPYFTAPLFIFFLLKKFDYAWNKDLRNNLIFLVPTIPIVFYRSLFNFYDEMASGQKYSDVIGSRVDLVGFNETFAEQLTALPLRAFILMLIILYASSFQKKWFGYYYWLFPINLLAILLQFS